MSWMEELSFLGLNMGKWRASPNGSLGELMLRLLQITNLYIIAVKSLHATDLRSDHG